MVMPIQQLGISPSLLGYGSTTTVTTTTTTAVGGVGAYKLLTSTSVADVTRAYVERVIAQREFNSESGGGGEKVIFSPPPTTRSNVHCQRRRRRTLSLSQIRICSNPTTCSIQQ